MVMGGYPVNGMSTNNVQVIKRESSSTKEALKRLEDQLAKVLLINEALWEIIREKHSLKDENLIEKIKEIDMRDGVADGKNQAREAPSCPSCGRNSSRRNRNCMYCGAELSSSIFSV
jgi:hypothetical protein